MIYPGHNAHILFISPISGIFFVLPFEEFNLPGRLHRKMAGGLEAKAKQLKTLALMICPLVLPIGRVTLVKS